MNIDLDAYRALFRNELSRLEESLRQATASTGSGQPDPSGVGRVSRTDAMQQQATAQELRARIATRKRRLEAALVRVEAGTFGCCCQCGEDLDVGRLEHDPAMVFCPDCAAERDNG